MGTNAKKICTKCGKLKFRRQAFTKHSATADGYHCWCRMCVRDYQRQYRNDNAEYIALARQAKREVRGDV